MFLPKTDRPDFHPPAVPNRHTVNRRHLWPNPKSTERGLPIPGPLPDPSPRSVRPFGLTERTDSRFRTYFIVPRALRFSVYPNYGEALSERGNSSAQAGEIGSGIGSLTTNSSLSGPQGPGTFVEQSAVMARGGHRNPAALSLRPPLPAQAHPHPYFANSLRNCPFPPCAS